MLCGKRKESPSNYSDWLFEEKDEYKKVCLILSNQSAKKQCVKFEKTGTISAFFAEAKAKAEAEAKAKAEAEAKAKAKAKAEAAAEAERKAKKRKKELEQHQAHKAAEARKAERKAAEAKKAAQEKELKAIAEGKAILAEPDACKVLGVRSHASPKLMKKAKLKLAKVHHPDKFQTEEGKAQATQVMAKISNACEVLSNSDSKLKYDMGFLKNWATGNDQDTDDDESYPPPPPPESDGSAGFAFPTYTPPPRKGSSTFQFADKTPFGSQTSGSQTSGIGPNGFTFNAGGSSGFGGFDGSPSACSSGFPTSGPFPSSAGSFPSSAGSTTTTFTSPTVTTTFTSPTATATFTSSSSCSSNFPSAFPSTGGIGQPMSMAQAVQAHQEQVQRAFAGAPSAFGGTGVFGLGSAPAPPQPPSYQPQGLFAEDPVPFGSAPPSAPMGMFGSAPAPRQPGLFAESPVSFGSAPSAPPMGMFGSAPSPPPMGMFGSSGMGMFGSAPAPPSGPVGVFGTGRTLAFPNP